MDVPVVSCCPMRKQLEALPQVILGSPAPAAPDGKATGSQDRPVSLLRKRPTCRPAPPVGKIAQHVS